MSSKPSSIGRDPTSGRLTGVRREVKALVSSETGAHALSRLQKRMSPKLVNGAPSSYRVSVYLDTEDRRFSRMELGEDNLVSKIRIRDYYLLKDNEPVFGDFCFFEVKTRFGQMVEKSRFKAKRFETPEILANGPKGSEDSIVRADHEAFENTRRGAPLAPLFVAHYRRYTLQDGLRCRITFDDLVSYHMAGRDALDTTLCSRKDLPPPLMVETSWVIEVKSLGAPPSWVEEILDLNQQAGYSKFGVGVRELWRRGLLFPNGDAAQ